MTYTTREDKELVRANVHKFVNSGANLSIKAYSRLMQWLDGHTFREIATEEHVTAAAVAYSVKHSIEQIKTFALSDNNH